MTAKIKLSKTGLVKWLKGRAPNRDVGVCGDAFNCVVARYLNDKSGRKIHMVDEFHIHRRNKVAIDTPRWVHRFINEWDMLDKPTAEATLRVLRNIKVASA